MKTLAELRIGDDRGGGRGLLRRIDRAEERRRDPAAEESPVKRRRSMSTVVGLSEPQSMRWLSAGAKEEVTRER